MKIRRLILICMTFITILSFVACTSKPPKQARTTRTTQKSTIVSKATQLREERYYLVELEFKKVQQNPAKNLENELKSVHKTVLVGERTFNEWEIGQEISETHDDLAFLFNGELSVKYQISIVSKYIEKEFFWQNKAGKDFKVSGDIYDAVLAKLKSSRVNLLQVPYAGVTVTYVLNKPLNQYEFVSKRPLTHYFVRVEVKNESLTLDFTKHWRNAANTHEIDIEVPEAVYTQTGEVWEPTRNVQSAIISGRLSTLHGRVIKKWTEVDTNFIVAITADGKEMVIPSK